MKFFLRLIQVGLTTKPMIRAQGHMASFLSGKITRYSFDTQSAFIGSLFVGVFIALR